MPGDSTMPPYRDTRTRLPGHSGSSGSSTCFTPIAPLASCTIDVTYNGYQQGYATLSLTDNASGSPQLFGLVGNVEGSGLVFTSAGLRFGQQAAGTSSAPRQVTLINGTASTVTINSIKSGGNFTQTHNCHATLAAGAYCYINVTFKPSSMGIKQGNITLGSVPGSPLVLPLLGTGDSATPNVTSPSVDSVSCGPSRNPPQSLRRSSSSGSPAGYAECHTLCKLQIKTGPGSFPSLIGG